MPNLTNTIEVYLKPVDFRSISFHHKGFYYLTFALKYQDNHKYLYADTFLREKQYEEQLWHRTNSKNQSEITSSISIDANQHIFSTDKFEISYNDQSVKFNKGCLFKIKQVFSTKFKKQSHQKLSKLQKSSKVKNEVRVDQNESTQQSIESEENNKSNSIKVQPKRKTIIEITLFREERTIIEGGKVKELTTPIITQVSSCEVIVNLQTCFQKQQNRSSAFNYAIFKANQYFSALQICLYAVDYGFSMKQNAFVLKSNSHIFTNQENQSVSVVMCCSERQIPRGFRNKYQSLKQFYNQAIRRKLIEYSRVKLILQREIEKYKQLKHSKKLNESSQFDCYALDADIADLDHIQIEDKYEELDYVQAQTNQMLNKTQELSHEVPLNLLNVLLQHYESNEENIMKHMVEDSTMISYNLKCLMEKIIQLTFSMYDSIHHDILKNQTQKNKIIYPIIERRQFISNQQLESREVVEICDFSEQTFLLHQKETKKEIIKFNFVTQQELKQPLVYIVERHDKKKVKGSKLVRFDLRMPESEILTVLVHGYKGNEFDLSKIKSYLNVYLGLTNFLSLRQIQEHIDQSIQELGERGANELTTYLNSRTSIRCINFIGFSLGGLIIRAMLPFLEKHLDKINNLITFASPHLGISIVDSCLVKTGLLYMNKIKGIKNIKELCNQKIDHQDTTLEVMASCPYLRKLNHIMLVSSENDRYVPVYSAIAEYRGADQNIRNIQRKFNAGLKHCTKCLVKFDYEESFWDVISQRKGHVTFLEDDAFLKYFFLSNKHLFTG